MNLRNPMRGSERVRPRGVACGDGGNAQAWNCARRRHHRVNRDARSADDADVDGQGGVLPMALKGRGARYRDFLFSRRSA
jgi:hypothetical protein